MKVTSAKEIRAALEKFENIRSDAAKKRRLVVQKAETSYRKAIQKGLKFREDFISQLEDVLLEIALEEDVLPYARDGSRAKPDSIHLSSFGIYLRWEADHPNDIIDFEISFDTIESKFNKPLKTLKEIVAEIRKREVADSSCRLQLQIYNSDDIISTIFECESFLTKAKRPRAILRDIVANEMPSGGYCKLVSID